MYLSDFEAAEIPLRTTGRMVRLAADSEPTVGDDGGALIVGTELLREDTGKASYWNGSAWKPVTLPQRIVQAIELLREIRDLLSEDQ